MIAPVIATVRTFWKVHAEASWPVTPGSFHERLKKYARRPLSKGLDHLNPVTIGRPPVSPEILVRALFCMTYARTSDLESAWRTRVDADWRAAMQVPDDFPGIDARTLALSRMRILISDKDWATFSAALFTDTGNEPLFTEMTNHDVLEASAVSGPAALREAYDLLSALLEDAGMPAAEAPAHAPNRAQFRALVAHARHAVAEVPRAGRPRLDRPEGLLVAVLEGPKTDDQVRRWRRSGTSTG